MTNVVVHSVQTGSKYFKIDSFLFQFISDKILEAQLFRRLGKSLQRIAVNDWYHLTITKYFPTTCTV